MSFCLDENLTEFHYPVKGQSNQQPVSFMGRFKAYQDDEEIDAMIERINDETAKDPNGVGKGMRKVAEEFFLGWTNPAEDQSLWVTHLDGSAMDCTPEGRAAMLKKPGVSIAICKAFQEARYATEAQLGNSESSRGNGFMAQVRKATPPG
jgi:hypothetical protein